LFNTETFGVAKTAVFDRDLHVFGPEWAEVDVLEAISCFAAVTTHALALMDLLRTGSPLTAVCPAIDVEHVR
jgi:hypothetical protein